MYRALASAFAASALSITFITRLRSEISKRRYFATSTPDHRSLGADCRLRVARAELRRSLALELRVQIVAGGVPITNPYLHRGAVDTCLCGPRLCHAVKSPQVGPHLL